MCIIFLSLCFFTYKMGLIGLLLRSVERIKWDCIYNALSTCFIGLSLWWERKTREGLWYTAWRDKDRSNLLRKYRGVYKSNCRLTFLLRVLYLSQTHLLLPSLSSSLNILRSLLIPSLNSLTWICCDLFSLVSSGISIAQNNCLFRVDCKVSLLLLSGNLTVISVRVPPSQIDQSL